MGKYPPPSPPVTEIPGGYFYTTVSIPIFVTFVAGCHSLIGGKKSGEGTELLDSKIKLFLQKSEQWNFNLDCNGFVTPAANIKTALYGQPVLPLLHNGFKLK